MYQITESTKIYIGCPPQFASGGPELLHQLCYYMKKKGINAYMYYYCKDGYSGNPVPERFLHYNTSFVDNIENNENNILIVPETMIDLLLEYTNIRRCLWWLGANHFSVPSELFSFPHLRVLARWGLVILGINKRMKISDVRSQNITNFAQCWYAVCFLEKRKIHNVAYLSDYISDSFVDAYLQHGDTFTSDSRENIVLYNPKRNTKYVNQLRKAAPDITFMAVENMTPIQVMELMKRAKLYIDFGSHPGKDRIPREAALQGCCILTSTLGSADFFDDVPIWSEYKFDRKQKNIKRIIEKIKYIFDNYDSEIQNFEGYRKYITSEKQRFSEDIDKLFVVKK